MPNWGAGLGGLAGGAAAGAAGGIPGILIGGALGGLSGLFGGDIAENNTYRQDPALLTETGYGGLLDASNRSVRSTLGQQQDFINMIRAQAMGQGGPSPAQLMLQQGMQDNLAGANSLLASQRGLNPALAARMALDQQAMQGQRLAGQAALLGAQEQAQARAMLGQALGQQGQLGLGSVSAAGGLQNAQNANRIANAGMAGGINAGVQGQNAAARNAALGGVLGGIGGAAAHLGRIGGGGGPSAASAFGIDQTGDIQMAHGGMVPMDSPMHDTVPAMLSPGEVVIPRSVVAHPHLADEFVRATLAGRRGHVASGDNGACGGLVRMADGGMVPSAAEQFARDLAFGPPTMPRVTLPDQPFDPFASASMPAQQWNPAAPPAWQDPAFSMLGVSPPPAEPAPFARRDIPVSEALTTAPSPYTLHPPEPTPAPVPASKPAPTASGLGELTRAQRQEQEGLRQAASVAADKAAEEARLAEAQAKDLAAMQARHQAIALDRQRGADKLFSDYQSAKLDPDRYWASMSTGGKISSAIGMILGGLGAGLSHGPNLAMAVIDKAIDRDIDAQKLEIGKKQNALAHYMQETGDIRLAQQLAKADARDVFAAQLSAAALKFGGPQAQAALEQQIGALRQKNVVDRMNVSEMEFKMGQERQAAREAEALKAATAAAGGITPQSLALYPKEVRERAVVANGRVVLAPSPERAKEAQAAIGQFDAITKALARAREMQRQDPHGVIDRSKQAKADSIHSQLLAAGKELFKLGALSDADFKLMNDMVPNVASLTPFAGATAAKLEELQNLITDRMQATLSGIGGIR